MDRSAQGDAARTKDSRTGMRRWLPWIVALVVVVALEVGFFNLGHWRTVGLAPVEQGTPAIGSGLESLGDGTYRITDPEQATVTVPISGTDGKPVVVGSVRVEPPEQPADPFASQTVAFSVKPVAGESSELNAGDFQADDDMDGLTVTDDGQVHPDDEWVDARDSDGGWRDPRHTLTYRQAPSSQYLLFGAKQYVVHATQARLTFLGNEGDTIRFERMEVNATIPFSLNAVRIALELAVAAFLVAFRPRSRLYRMRATDHARAQGVATAVFVVAVSLALALMARMTGGDGPEYMAAFSHWRSPDQYQELADALIHGHAWLDLPVDPALTTMANPYSFADRVTLATHGDHLFYWDHAYYQGHYYCYFGVVPAVLLFMPYQLLLGHAMPTWIALAVFCALATVFGTLLVRRLARDYFPNASIGMVWLAVFGFTLGTNLLTYTQNVDFYGVPITGAIAFTLMGLWFWQVSKRADGSVNPWLVAAGSLCMALDLGTRPQFLAAWPLAFPLFWQQITRHRTLFSRKGAWSTVAALAPFAVVAAPLLWYNRIRFGSWFDFGQYYNLTVYDLTARQGSPFLLPLELFTQLFQPVATSNTFPFLTVTDTYLAAPHEPSLGGYFAVVPWACMALGLVLVRRRLRGRHAWFVTWAALLLGFVALLFDCYKSGTTMRYYGDFAYLAVLAAVFVALAFESAAQGDGDLPTEGLPLDRSRTLGYRTLVTVSVTLVAVTLAIAFFGLFATGRYDPWRDYVPNVYSQVQSWFIGLTF